MAVPVTVVAVLGRPASLDLHGPLAPTALEAALAQLPECDITLHRHTPTHHTLLLPDGSFPAGALADLLTSVPPAAPAAGRRTGRPGRLRVPTRAGRTAYAGPASPIAVTMPATPLQRDILLDAVTRPGGRLHIGQVHWRWHGPLHISRFTAAWQAVFDREAVLRTVVAEPLPDGQPKFAVRSLASPRITRYIHAEADWHALLADERLRDFDLRRPGPLRIALLEEPYDSVAGGRPTRVVITYHRALLDRRSVSDLIGSFYRAYLADGCPRGGERRPDLRDHQHWLSAQDVGPARAFWSAAAPPPGAAILPARPATRRTGQQGHGRITERLAPCEAIRLRAWAAASGAAESTALYAAWALLLHRAARGPGHQPTTVAFSAALSGCGIPVDGAASLPAPLRNPLPVSVDVDPAATLTELLRALSGRILDTAAYEWVSAGQILAWAGRSPHDDVCTESVVSFEPPAGSRPGRPGCPELEAELAAHGVRVESPQAVEGHAAVPVTLDAHQDHLGNLVLTVAHDRARISDAEAAAVLAQTVRLLRELPVSGFATVAEALGVLATTPSPVMAPRPAGLLDTLREGAYRGAGTICLLPPTGAPPGCYDQLATAHPGPEALVTVPAGADAAACLAALGPVLATGDPLLLGCFSGAGALAYEVADRIAAHGWPPPLVAVGGLADGKASSVHALLRTIGSATGTSRVH
ncbi:condensation domain-containing protein [Streptomyces agglomeratus]|uniref:condensation domain-containing protein n=1 Tax=Streptomyces agglomeratus TaxID=285458 RepID=UPI000854C0D9|nr:condensation domain-containing protein [Streptomyces agglomeratus]OEJ36270.1 hypothetical protein BGK72_38555 [Streptomyces agglomeratus]